MSDMPKNCDNCGACCTHMATPPGHAAYFPPKGLRIPKWAQGVGDAKYIAAMPQKVWDETRRLFDEAWATNRSALEVPCFWYDEKTRRCKHWEYRPSVCRNFQIGEPACIAHRERVGITLNGKPV